MTAPAPPSLTAAAALRRTPERAIPRLPGHTIEAVSEWGGRAHRYRRISGRVSARVGGGTRAVAWSAARAGVDTRAANESSGIASRTP